MSELQKMKRAQKDFDKYMLLSPTSYGKAGKEDLLSEALSGFLGRTASRLGGGSSDVVRTDPYSRSVPATSAAATSTPTSPTRGQPEAPYNDTLMDPVDPFGEEVKTPDGEVPEPDAETFTPQKRPRNNEEKIPVEKEEKVESIPDAQGHPPMSPEPMVISQTQPFASAGEFIPPGAAPRPHPAEPSDAHLPAPETSANDTDKIINQVSTQVANQLSNQFTELFGQMSTDITKLTSEMGKIDTIGQKVTANSKAIKGLKNTTEQNIRKHTIEINEKVSANGKELADLAKRVMQLEANPTRPSSTAAAAPSTPNRAPDPWAEYKMRSPPPSTATTPKPSPLASSPTTSPTPPTFCPRHVHVQGWASFKSPDGLPPGEAKAIALSFKNLLGPEHQNLIQDVKADFWVNTRFTFLIKIGHDDFTTKESCWTLKRALDDALNRNDFKVKSKKVYAVVEAPPHIHNKNKVMAIAIGVLEGMIADKSDHLRKDFRAGALYWSNDGVADTNLILIGRLRVSSLTWTWTEGLARALPDLGSEVLASTTEQALADE